ncbi:hypothetical protein [Echinicola vietnamensis]|uniref:Uncharacterized protein n=1 Tax=Echinicola vietnamensis (strain DSM 17526 / LMG 23754 / KMM 6221) TaxID=926556 RepID=L0G278_ECHVK|nr:hypothetical protein [Echinicola vietnamensis]AGA79632.1 hypothetical protein Echvi_3412 [Echinicola vietnamensis DSM 17526]
MGKQKVIGALGVFAVLLITCLVLWNNYFLNSSDHGFPKKETVTITAWNSYSPKAVNLPKLNYHITVSNVDHGQETDYVADSLVYGLKELERQVLERAYLCSLTAIPFGIKEMIFPSHFFW